MNDKNQNELNESQLDAPQRLMDDLQELYSPPESIRFETDRAVIDQARRHFTKQRFDSRKQTSKLFRWVAVAASAAAAVILVTFMINPARELSKISINPDQMEAMAVSINQDIDQNGRVDILDALYLARRIETAGELIPQWDFNGDGDIDRTDVDTVAQAAVRLGKDGL